MLSEHTISSSNGGVSNSVRPSAIGTLRAPRSARTCRYASFPALSTALKSESKRVSAMRETNKPKKKKIKEFVKKGTYVLNLLELGIELVRGELLSSLRS